MMDDPFDWTLDRVIQELCTTERSWKPLVNPPRLPDRVQLEKTLRENEVEGWVLLSSDPKDLCLMLFIKTASHVTTITRAIEQLRNRSKGYKRSLQDQNPDEDQADHTASTGLVPERRKPGPTDVEVRESKDRLRKFLQNGCTPLVAAKTNGVLRQSPIPPNHSPRQGSEKDQPSLETNQIEVPEPAPKKRRLALNDLETNALEPDALRISRTIPTAADDAPSLRALVSSALHVPAGSYLPQQGISRLDFIDGSFTPQGLELEGTENDFTFTFVRQTTIPLGRQLQAHRIHKRLFSARFNSAPTTRGMPDTVAGALDPEHDEILPLLGGSDDDGELDAQTWKEIEKEKLLREKEEAKRMAQAKSAYLSTEEVVSVLDEFTESIIKNWQERKLISLKRGAYKKWRESRVSLHSCIRGAERVLNHLQARLSTLRREILEQQWKTREDIWGMSAALEATVTDAETSRWELQLLRSPVAPERMPSLPQPRKREPPQTLQPLGEDEEEILTSDDEDDLDNFIVDDHEANISDVVDSGDLRVIGDDNVPMELESESAQGEKEELAKESETSPGLAVSEATSENQNNTDAQAPQVPTDDDTKSDIILDETTSGIEPLVESEVNPVLATPVPSEPPLPVDKVLRTPSKGRFADREIVDLTQSPTDNSGYTTPTSTKARSNINKTPSRNIPSTWRKTKEEPTSSYSARSIPSSTPAQVGAKESYLEFDYDAGTISQQIAHLINGERDEVINFIFTIVQQWGQKLWDDIVHPLFLNFDYPKDSNRLDIKVSYRFVSMLQIWDGQESMSPRKLKRANRVTKEEILARVKTESRRDFTEFLSERLLERFVWEESGIAKALFEPRQEADNNASKIGSDIDAEYGASDQEPEANSQNTPRKKKRLTTLDKQAREMRRDDVARTVEQEARRQALRARLQAYGDVSDAQFIINESKDEEDGFIHVHQDIAKRIKTHQVDGVRFMWNLIVAARGTKQGCLLAHSMGLGKTMQVITLLVAITDAANSVDETVHRQIPEELREARFLVLCPPALINNWNDEFLCWVPDEHHLGHLYKVDSDLEVGERVSRIRSWGRNGGVLLLSYSLFRTSFDDQELQKVFKERPNLVVADEAHMFKNPKSKLHIAAAEFVTQSRIAMTGSPLANNVEEYHSMINWIAPNYLSDIKAFRSHFAKPIHDGLQITSSSYERRKAMQRLHFLKKEVAPKVDRKTIAVLRNSIPKKTEFVLVMPLTKIQWKAYELMIQHQRGLMFDSDKNASTTVFATLGVLGLLCAHPVCFKQRLGKQRKISAAKKSTTATSAGSADTTEPEDEMTEEQACANLDPQLVAEQQLLVKDVERIREDIDLLAWKVKIFMAIVEECQKCGDSVLVFSQSLGTLDYLDKKLTLARIPHERLDGATKMGLRQGMIKNFNDSATSRVFLISTTAGGLGLNITGANRVIIFDFKFNPQHEQQAIGRAYRIGQTKPVYVYRLICGGTFEEMLLDRIVFKMQLAERVVDKKNPIPKAQQFAEFLKMPTDPPQKDLTKYEGHDKVLDAVLKSDARRGLRSILTMDTFEEEELDTYEATEAERVEMEALMRPGASFAPALVGLPTQHPQDGFLRQRLPPVTQTPPVVTQSSGLAPPLGARLSPFNPANVSPKRSVPQEVEREPASQPLAPSLPVIMPIEPLDGPHAQAAADVPLPPIAGASTSFWRPDSAGYRPSQLRFNRAELKRLFLETEPGSKPLTEEEKTQRTQSAYKLAQLLTEKKPLSKALQNAVLKAAESPSFSRAVSNGTLPVEHLVNMEPGSIEQWQNMMVAQSLTQQQTLPQPLPQPPALPNDSEHLRNRLRRMSSISNGDATAHKPHQLGDRAAMEAVLARRADRAPQQSNGPAFVRLPTWANNLIREGSSRQSSFAPSSSATDISNQPSTLQAPLSSAPSPTIHVSPQRTKTRPKNPFLSD